jgi:hypothetical protein
MKSDEQNFKSLRRLLALKRHEVPPPGYFDRLAREVAGRIKAGEQSEFSGFAERFSAEASWLDRFWAVLEARPIAATLCGIAACGMLVSGLVYSEKKGDSAPIAVFMAPEIAGGVEMASQPSSAPPSNPSLTPVGASLTPSSTGGLMPSGAQSDSLFNIHPALNVQPAGHLLPAGQ